MGYHGQPERRAFDARLRGPDLLQLVAETFEGFRVKLLVQVWVCMGWERLARVGGQV